MSKPKRHHIDRRAAKLVEAAETSGDPDELISTKELADWLGCSPQWCEIARHRGYGPKFKKLSPRRVRYMRRDVLRWLAGRTHQSTKEAARATMAVK